MSMRISRALPVVLATALLVACGGNSADATIGGSVSGLNTGQSLVLADNGTSNLTVTANGNFAFSATLPTGATYDVTVVTQPAGQTCTVANSSGTAAGTSVTLSNGSVLLPIASNGAFAFPGVLTAGSAYAVTIAVQPAGETCVLSNASGTIPASRVTSVVVACS